MQLQFFRPNLGHSHDSLIFQRTRLGQLHSTLPIAELAALLPEPQNSTGAKPWFDNYGKVALQFLKAYEGCSDAKLLERINTDWSMQLFCGIRLGKSEWIKDKDIIWKARSFVAAHLTTEEAQPILIRHWKPWMGNLGWGMCDATCYESYIRYPTDVKLLWQSAEWLHERIALISKELGQPRPRSKYNEQRKKQIAYSRRRRKAHGLQRRRCRQLLHLCAKLLGQLALLFEQYRAAGQRELCDEAVMERYGTIAQVYAQQQWHYDNPGEPVPERIVSLHKPYIRPIVRGKENKRTEFGAKVNTWQAGGLNFIEHFSFEAFHEGVRLKEAIAFHRKHFGQLDKLAADAIYATNDNRSYCSDEGISTSFKPKGRRTSDAQMRKEEDQQRAQLGKARSTELEGSYGNDKNHYGLRKIKARNEHTEITWIFFGMMTANAMKVARRKHKKLSRSRKARAA